MADQCPSLVELLDLPGDRTDQSWETKQHVDACPRCAALIKTLPTLDSGDSVAAPSLHFEPSTKSESPDDFGAGQIWQAIAPELPEERRVVVLLQRHRQDENSLVVAPTSSQVSNATEVDLIVEASPLPYRFMVCPWNFGVVIADQLDEFLGQLPEERLAELRELYRFILGGDPMGLSPHVGPAVESPRDERLIWRSEQIAEMKPLYAPWANRFDDTVSQTEAPTDRLSVTVAAAMEADGHDSASLAETAHVSQASIAAVLEDRLDLTDQRDVDDVASIASALRLSFSDIELPLKGTLHAQTGGVRVGLAPTERIAARKRPGLSASQARDLLRDGLSEIDESTDGRTRAIASYMRAVSDRLE